MRLKEFISEEESAAIAKTAQDLVNPPVKMQHRARRDQEREQTYQNAQRGRNDDDDLDEGTGNIGSKIKALYQKIYDQGDDSIDYMYHESPVFAQIWDEYEGDLDSIIAEVDPSELQVIANELEAYLQGPGLAEMHSDTPKGRYKADGTRSHSTYGSRDHYSLGDPETTLGPDSVIPAKDVAKKAGKELDKAFDNSHKKGVAEAFIAPALSAANAAAEFRRQGQAGGGYRGRIDIPVDSEEDYLEAGRALKRAAKLKGQHIEYGLSGRTMSVFSDTMNSDELDAFIDDAFSGLGESVAEDLDRVRNQLSGGGYMQSQQDWAQDREQDRERLRQRREREDQRYDAERDAASQAYIARWQHEIDALAHRLKGMDRDDDDWERTYDMLRDRINRYQYSTQRDVDPEQLAAISNIQYQPRRKKTDFVPDVAEGEKIAGRYDPDDWDAMVGRLKKLAGMGPLKTVWDEKKRVYKNVPVAVQPAQQPRKEQQ